MDFSKLNQNEKLAVYGSIAAIVGPILSSAGFGFGAGGLTLLLAIAMLVIVFIPQFSPQTVLPGSKGSLMLVVGGIAAASAALALVSSLGWLGLFGSNLLFVLGWLIGIAGGLLMGWAAWQEFQAEGGTFQLGTSGAATATPPPPTATPPSDAAPAVETRASEAPAADGRPVEAAPESVQPDARAAEASDPTDDRPA